MLAETDKRTARMQQLAQDQTASFAQLRKEAGAALSAWLDNRDQGAAAQIQKLLNSWPCERSDAAGYASTTGRKDPVGLRGAA